MIISVASGKGGTGKTTVATSLALSLPGTQLLDCDVEEPNSHLFIKPAFTRKESVSIPVPRIDDSKCTYCGTCQRICMYNALAVLKDKVLVFPELCHGCGACHYLCPEGAIQEVPKEIGHIEAGSRDGLDFIHGRLNIGEAMAPPLIRAVKNAALPDKTTVIDAPPGTSCPVIEAVKDSDYCILVTEPTPFGLNDLMLAVLVMRKLTLPFGVVINRADLGDLNTETYCARENIPVLLRIPFERRIAEGYSRGDTIVRSVPEYKERFESLFTHILGETDKREAEST